MERQISYLNLMAPEYWKELELKWGRFNVGIWKLKVGS